MSAVTSTTQIANLALSHLGMAKQIGNLNTETSAEASACRTFYDISRDIVLRDFEWPFASRIFTLGLIEENPNEDWSYSYRYPSDAIKIKKILSGTRNETNETRIPFKIGSDDSGHIIYSDKSEAECEYTKRITDVSLFPADFVMAMSLRLAFYIAPRITRGDPFKMRDSLLNNYYIEASRSSATSVNEEQDDVEPDSEFIRTRG